MSEQSLRTELQRAERERVRLESALRDSNHRLATALTRVRQLQYEANQNDQLREIGQIASGVAHNLNNDLAMIVGVADIMLKHPENLENVEKARSYLQMIRSATSDATSLVLRLGDYVKTDDQGTTPLVNLPLESPDAFAEEPVSSPEMSGTPRRILVVEDETSLRRILREYLVHAGHSVELTANGREGLDRFLEAQTSSDARGRFDLVMTDLSMPEMSGDQLAVAVKAASPATPVILLTGFGDLVRNSREPPPEVDLIVPKPFSLESLQRAVATVV